MTDREPACLADIGRAAAARLPKDVWDFLAGGSGREQTLAADRAALDRLYVVPRVLRDVSACATTATLLNRSVTMPIAVAPIAFHRLFHPEGELATARAAKAHGVPCTVSTMSSVALEEVVAVGGPVWFQLYWLRDRERSLALVRRAEDAGCEAVVLTVDMPWMGRRLRDVRNGFALPSGVHAANLEPASAARGAAGRAVAAHANVSVSGTLGWADVGELRASTRLPLVLKGVLAAEDAVRAADLGVDAVVVSNHGGRQLDGAVPAVAVLEEVCEAVGGRCEVLVDGAIRSGVDVLRVLALGATGVLVGRPLMWGLAVGGAEGVRRVLDILAEELRDALGLAGCESVAAAGSLRVVATPHAAAHGSGLDRP